MKSEQITSKDNKKVKFALEQKEGKGEYFISEGFHLAEVATEENLAEAIFSLKPFPSSCVNYLVNEQIIKKLASTINPEGIVTLSKKPISKPISSDKVLFLDDVSDPGNMGTLLRTALAFGFKDVILLKGANPFKAKVVQSSQGAIYKLNIKQIDDISILDELKKDGYQIIGTDLKSSIPLSSLDKKEKIVLILGNEARGVSGKVLEKGDVNVRIEIDSIESLNVAMAGSILMYELR